MRLLTRRIVVFVALFALYQTAEGIGARLLHSFSVQAGLMLACVLAAWPLGHWLGMGGLPGLRPAGPAGLAAGRGHPPGCLRAVGDADGGGCRRLCPRSPRIS
jgi:hypothetical protein